MMTDTIDEDAIFLIAVKKYIEDTQVKIDCEWGLSRELEELIASGEMPEVYYELLRRLD